MKHKEVLQIEGSIYPHRITKVDRENGEYCVTFTIEHMLAEIAWSLAFTTQESRDEVFNNVAAGAISAGQFDKHTQDLLAKMGLGD